MMFSTGITFEHLLELEVCICSFVADNCDVLYCSLTKPSMLVSTQDFSRFWRLREVSPSANVVEVIDLP